jgi:hypothetical protein
MQYPWELNAGTGFGDNAIVDAGQTNSSSAGLKASLRRGKENKNRVKRDETIVSSTSSG